MWLIHKCFRNFHENLALVNYVPFPIRSGSTLVFPIPRFSFCKPGNRLRDPFPPGLLGLGSSDPLGIFLFMAVVEPIEGIGCFSALFQCSNQTLGNDEAPVTFAFSALGRLSPDSFNRAASRM